MSINRRKFLAAAALIPLLAYGVSPAFAQTAKPPAQEAAQPAPQTQDAPSPAAGPLTKAEAEAYRSDLKESARMLGEMGSARLLIDLGLVGDARNHIDEAVKIAGELEKSAPEIIARDTVKFGKSTYNYKGEQKEYIIPVIDDVLMVKDFDVLERSKREANVDEIDSNIVRYRMSMNIRETHKMLIAAQEAVAKGDGAAALKALDDVYKAAFVEEEGFRDPLLSMHDNLMLAHNQIVHKNFPGAQAALGHAKSELKKYQTQGKDSASHSEAIARIAEEIGVVQDELKRDNPSIADEAGAKIGQWTEEIGRWVNP